MYTPQNSIPIDEIKIPQIRLLLLGKPGTGKTFSIVTTFPNVVVADLDGGLGCPELKGKGAVVLPFNSEEWINTAFSELLKRSGLKRMAPKDAFKYWLNTEARNLEVGQTLLIDSLTAVCNEFHKSTEPAIPINKDGKPDGYYIWGEKQKYLRDLHIIMKSLKCHIVLTAHEKELRDPDSGVMLGKVQPLLTGGYVEEIASHYTDVYRSLSGEEKGSDGKPTGKTLYFWQVKPDDKYDLKSRITRTSKFVEPGFKAFSEYFNA